MTACLGPIAPGADRAGLEAENRQLRQIVDDLEAQLAAKDRRIEELEAAQRKQSFTIENDCETIANLSNRCRRLTKERDEARRELIVGQNPGAQWDVTQRKLARIAANNRWPGSGSRLFPEEAERDEDLELDLRMMTEARDAALHRRAEERVRADEAEADSNLRSAQLAMVGSELCGDPKIDPYDWSDPRVTPTLREARHARLERDKAEAERDEARIGWICSTNPIGKRRAAAEKCWPGQGLILFPDGGLDEQ